MKNCKLINNSKKRQKEIIKTIEKVIIKRIRKEKLKNLNESR